MLTRPLFIGSEIYRASSYGRKHPLAIPRVSTAIDLSHAMGWLDHRSYLDSPMATPDQLARYHDRTYIDTVRRAEADQRLDPESVRSSQRPATHRRRHGSGRQRRAVARSAPAG